MSKNVIHNFDILIQNSTDVKSAEHLTDVMIKELAKISKEMSQQKDIEQLWLEQKSQNPAVNNSNFSVEGGVNDTIARAALSVNNTPLVFGEAGQSFYNETTLSGTTPFGTTNFNTSIGEGVADTIDSTMMSAALSANTTSPIFGVEDDALNLSKGVTNQIYSGGEAQQTLTIPEKLQTNGEPTLEAVKEAIRKKIEQANAANDRTAVEYWTTISKAFDENKGVSVQDFDGKPNHALFTEMYAALKQLNSVTTAQNFNWEIVREKMIKAIDSNILMGEISEGSKKRWKTIQQELQKDTANVANLFEQYNELFLLLRQVEGLDELPGTITITTKTKIYPNLSADRLYAEIGKEAVYVFLKEIKNEDLRGNAVKRGAVKIKNTNASSFIVGESLEFFLDETLIVQNGNKNEAINWIVYKKNKDKKYKETIFEDEGTSFSYNFDAEGPYVIEAYGHEFGANKKKSKKSFAFVEVKIVAQELVILPPSTVKGRLVRPSSKEFIFKTALKPPKINTLNPLKFYYQIESKTNNKVTSISEEKELDPTGSIKLMMPDLGTYKIKVIGKDQYALTQEFEVSAIKNEVTSIGPAQGESNKNVFLLGGSNKTFTLEAKTFKIPPTDKEKQDVKWIVYDSNNNPYLTSGDIWYTEKGAPKRKHLHKWESFGISVPDKEGHYTVEAFSDAAKGVDAKATFKMEVQRPQVTEAYWAYSNGDKKETSGFSGEVNHVKASIPGYDNQKVRISFYLNGSKEPYYYSDTTTDGSGEINKVITFDDTFQRRFGIQEGKTAKISFKLMGIQNDRLYPFKRNADVNKDSILDVTAAVRVTDLYFEYKNSRVNLLTPVPFGAKVKGVIKTLNKVGHEVVLKIYKNTGDIIHTAKVKVNNEGVAIISFTLKKEWNTINPLTGMMDVFYLGMEGVESKFSIDNGLNAVFVSNIVGKKDEDKYGVDVLYFLAKYKGKNVENLKVLLDDMNEYYTSEKVVPRKEHVAYMLATVYTETFKTFKPVIESFWITDKEVRERSYHRYDPVLADSDKRKAKAIERGNTQKGDGVRYCGRGYVQLTWKNNYKKVKEQFGIDVVEYPDKVLEPKLAAKIMIWGMNNGIFTDVSINKYINDSKTDYVNARKVINGTDLEKEIAGDAEKFEKHIKIIKSKNTIKSKSLNDALEEMKIIADKHLPYAMEENVGESKGLRTGLNDTALEKMDCSEFVCRYLYKLGITDEVKWVTTGSMTSESSFQKALGTDKIKFVGKSRDFEPQAGDIFVWRNGNAGHTGIVYKFDSTNDLVTILESIGSSGSNDNTTNKKNGGYALANCTRTSVYKSKGKALFAHPGFIGYFRPQKK